MSAKIPFQIEIPRRGFACAKGQEVLSPGTAYYSTVLEGDDGRLHRQDFCAACWDAIKHLPEHSAKTHWKSRVAGKKLESDRNLNRDERALELLKEALKQSSPEVPAEAFVLALYLVRRRVLAYRQQMQQDDGAVISLYEVVATEEMLGVRSIALSQLQIESLQQRIAAKLSSPKV